MVRALIVGTGDHANGLAHLFSISNCRKSSGSFLEVTKPSVTQKGAMFHHTGVPVVPFDDGLCNADIVILAIPSGAVKEFVTSYSSFLKEKIIVDATNSSIPGEDLHSILAMTNLKWVKAFNDIGAADVLLKKPGSKTKLISKICSSHADAVKVVTAFAETSMGLHMKIVPCEQYQSIATQQASHGTEWVVSGYIMLIVFGLCEVYAVMRYNVHKGYDWFHLPLQVTNKAICWTATTGFSFAQLPGVLARMSDAIFGNTLRNKPTWLICFLGMRKHLGLMSLWFLSLHILMSLILFNPGYYGKFFLSKDGTSKLNSIGENSFLFATLGTGLYIILGICSLPSVGTEMTSKQWQVVYGPMAWFALAFGTIHVLIMGVKGWNDQEGWPGNLPPITLTATMIPLAVMFLKLVQILLCRLTWALQSSYSSKTSESVGLMMPTDDMESDDSKQNANKTALVTLPKLLDDKHQPRVSQSDMAEDEGYGYMSQQTAYAVKQNRMHQMEEDIA